MSCLRFIIFATSFIRELDRIGGWCGLFAMKTKLRTKQDWPPGKGTTSERREKAFGLLGCKSIVERHVKIYEIIRWFVWCLGKLYILENENGIQTWKFGRWFSLFNWVVFRFHMNFQGCTLELLGHFLDTTPYSCHHIHQDMFYVLFVSFWHRPRRKFQE